ncbi:MAG: hypothetical protein QM831_28660 [Kofleriaceae bacterium]
MNRHFLLIALVIAVIGTGYATHVPWFGEATDIQQAASMLWLTSAVVAAGIWLAMTAGARRRYIPSVASGAMAVLSLAGVVVALWARNKQPAIVGDVTASMKAALGALAGFATSTVAATVLWYTARDQHRQNAAELARIDQRIREINGEALHDAAEPAPIRL